MLILSFLSLLVSFIVNTEPLLSDPAACVSEEEKVLFEIINSYRETRGLPVIPFSSSMTKVAQTHAKDLSEHYTYKKGARCNPHSWSKNGDWSDCCYTNDHKKAQCMWDKPKEIAGYESYGYEILFYSSDGATAGEALEGWQKSPAHHAVMINSNIWEKVTWGAMGIGIYGEYAAAWFGEMEEEAPLNELELCPGEPTEPSDTPTIKISGSGFALSSDGYIVTNHHITNGANNIKIRGIMGDFFDTYDARVVIEDKKNDLAIIKIEDSEFKTLGKIPYSLDNGICDVGSSVFTLGFPLRSSMGDEVKLTNGIISSKSGFNGDITTYQISVPVQPGNSGGPLFDSKGNVVGIISAKHIGAENASYAIKTNYLKNLIESMNSIPTLPTNNVISNKNLSEQVKLLKDYVYIIEVN